MSLVARYLRDWGYLNCKVMVRGGLGLGCRLAHPAAPAALQNFAAIAFPGFPAKVAQTAFIRRHTLLPYFLAFESREKATSIVSSLTKTGRPLVNPIFHPATRLLGQPQYLRFCPKCLRSDIRRFGGGYWHRIHQLPGVIRCAEHDIPLYDSQHPYTGIRWDEMRAPSAISCLPDEASLSKPLFGPGLTHFVQASTSKVFRRGAGSAYVSKESYRRTLQVLGLDKFRGPVQATAIELDFGEWLKANDGDVRTLDLARWLRSLFTRGTVSATPLQHIVFRAYLSARLAKGNI